jgi:ATP-dependent Clp protease ATP-binding subunit ClpA
MLTRELEETLSYAVDEAVKHKHEYVTLEHLLFALLEDAAAREILFNCGAEIDELARALSEYFDNVLEKFPSNTPARFKQRSTMQFCKPRAAVSRQSTAVTSSPRCIRPSSRTRFICFSSKALRDSTF